MDKMYDICCGLDVHKKSIVACIVKAKGKDIKTFGTMTDDILALIDWIKDNKCECVAMESTGVYWKPIYNLLELNEIRTMVVNAKHIKNVPGRKTDVKDAQWIANLLKHGLLKGSYIPSRDQRELRELTRYRRSIVEERSREISRLQKILEGANIKLSSVISNVLGVSGRLIIEGIIDGTEDPEILAAFAKKSLKNKGELLKKSLKGLIGCHQKMLLKTQLEHIDFLNQKIEEISSEIKSRLGENYDIISLLDTIPGVGEITAQDIIAEIGCDMEQFPSASHLASWAGLTPGNNESAGKKKVVKPEMVTPD